ncbi:MAG: hypothetical protein HOW73_12670 [Polyangiaceae bacterium]|nr:hypothetical protein [Polyangiaceae bacterium]
MPGSVSLRGARGAAIVACIASALAACADVRPPIPPSYGGDGSSEQPAALAILPSHETEDEDPAPAADMTSSDEEDSGDAGAHPFREPLPALGSDTTASRFAGLSDRECAKELERRGLPFEPSEERADGISKPLRVNGPIHEIRFVTPRAPSPFGMLDCRLALALGDLATALARYDVVEVRVDNFYRKNAALPGKRKGKKRKLSQHAHALAADITALKLKDGRTLSVPGDWHAPIGSVSCGPDAVMNEPSANSIELRNIVCDVARQGIFHHMLTPSYNAAHQSHFHFDLERGAKKSSVR